MKGQSGDGIIDEERDNNKHRTGQRLKGKKKDASTYRIQRGGKMKPLLASHTSFLHVAWMDKGLAIIEKSPDTMTFGLVLVYYCPSVVCLANRLKGVHGVRTGEDMPLLNGSDISSK